MYKVSLKTAFPAIEFEFETMLEATDFVGVALGHVTSEPLEFSIKKEEVHVS